MMNYWRGFWPIRNGEIFRMNDGKPYFMTLIYFVLHSELSNFSNGKHGFSFLGEDCWYHQNRSLVNNLYTILKASGPKRHPIQDAK